MTTWQRYVAIGDSFTEGMSDPDPTRPGSYLGWADRLATALSRLAADAGAEFKYANLAVRGRTLSDVVGAQLQAALAMGPDLVSVVGGGNDILRPSVDLDAIAASLDEAVSRIRTTGADVLMATPTDTRDSGLFKPLRPRHAIHTANIFSIAQRHGAHVLNLWGLEPIRDWRMWSEDRIHLSTQGHARVALAALEALGRHTPEVLDDAWRAPLPPAERALRRDELREHLRWVRTHAAPWVQRRVQGTSSGDHLSAKLPTLVPWPPRDSPPT